MQYLIKEYLQSLSEKDYDKLLSLFTEDAVVRSPLYGERLANTFYKELFADTKQSEVLLKEVFINSSGNKAAFLFEYGWTLSDNTFTTFDCIDIIEVNEENKITQLHIIYDTAKVRSAFELLKS